jgi:ATP-binding cassette, subfamily B, multidrug efflux pump
MNRPSKSQAPPPSPRQGGLQGGHGPAGQLSMPVAKPKDFRQSGRRLLRLMRPHRWAMAAVIAASVASVTFSITGPKLLGAATTLVFEGVVSKSLPAGTSQMDAVAAAKARGQRQLADMLSGMHLTPGVGVDFGALGRIALLLALVYTLSAVFSWVQQYLTVGISQGIVFGLRHDAEAKLARLPLRYFDSHPRGDILSRVTNDIDNIANTLQQSLSQIVIAALSIAGVLIMMFSIDVLLAGVSLLTVPVSVAVALVIATRGQKQFALQWKRTGDLNGHVEEMLTGRAIVKAFGREQESERVFDEKNAALCQAGFRAQFISGIIMPAMGFVTNLNYVAVAIIGGLKVASGRLSLGDVQAFIQYSRQFSWPITQVAGIMNVMQSAVASAERVFELLDEEEESPEPAVPVVLPASEGRIRLEGVSFRYESSTALIDHLDLDIRPGQTVAIVGPTGAGKTTLVNLLLRFYEIDGGAITIDGVDTRQMTRNGLRSLFGMVLQDAWLFSGSIRENIAYGREGATPEQIEAAARAAYVDHFVRTLPDGYDTALDDEAASLSQGEKQLLTIARAFLADPQILILDEATSSVDTRTEILVQKAMARLMKGRTAFVIAHRLSTIRDADLILVMDRGRLVERGTQEELLAARGSYYDLYHSQFADACDGAA